MTTSIVVEIKFHAVNPITRGFRTVRLGNNYFRIPKLFRTFVTKELKLNEQHHRYTDTVDENSNASGVEEHSIVNNETNNGVRETGSITIIDSSSSDEESSEDDKPLSERLDEINAIILRSASKLRGKSHTCPVCHIIFNRKSILTSHLATHNDSRPYRCDVCSKSFKTRSCMMGHMDRHYERTRDFSCDDCGYLARCNYELKQHYIRIHTDECNFSCEQCGKLFKLECDMKAHMKDHDPIPCVCDICGSFHPSKKSLYYHRQYQHRISKNKKAYQCKICKKRFSTRRNLESHGELHDRKYVCEQCGKEFNRKYGLTKHMRAHSTEKKCLCAVCGKTFKSLSAQKIHSLTHVGERPYVCDVCGNSFTQRTPMMLHRRTKHPEVRETPPPVKIADLINGVKDKIITNKSNN